MLLKAIFQIGSHFCSVSIQKVIYTSYLMKPEQHAFSAARDNVYVLSEAIVWYLVCVINGVVI